MVSHLRQDSFNSHNGGINIILSCDLLGHSEKSHNVPITEIVIIIYFIWKQYLEGNKWRPVMKTNIGLGGIWMKYRSSSLKYVNISGWRKDNFNILHSHRVLGHHHLTPFLVARLLAFLRMLDHVKWRI